MASEHHTDPYRELGLSPEAASEPELVRAAFKALAKKYHPDGFPDAAGKATAEEKMRRLNEAQRLILSGEYRPPAPVPPGPSSVPVVLPQQRSERATPAPAMEPNLPSGPPQLTIPLVPLAVISILLLLGLALPAIRGGDHLRQAQGLEEQGRLADALEQANRALSEDPRNGKAYLLRARLWHKLGKPERAATDLSNARTLVAPADFAAAQATLTPAASPTPAPSTPTPKGGD